MFEPKTTPEDRAERAEQALHRILQWAEAYPEDVFPPVDVEAARAKLGDDALFSKLHAEWARRLTKGMMRYARAGLGLEPEEVLYG